MKDFMRWFRRGIPLPRIAVPGLYFFGLCFSVTLLIGLLDVILTTYSFLPSHDIVSAVVSEFSGMFPVLVAFMGFILLFAWGALRPLAHHPSANQKYRIWLLTTPWQPGKPLPMGPLGVTAQDSVVIVMVSFALFLFTPAPVHFGPMVFLVAYCLASLLILVPNGDRGYAYAIAFGLGVPLGLLIWSWAAFAALVTLYVIAHRGVVRSLDGYPWEADVDGLMRGANDWWGNLARGARNGKSPFRTRGHMKLTCLAVDLGWPLGALRYRWQRSVISRADGLLLALLPGYYIGIITLLWRMTPTDDPGLEHGLVWAYLGMGSFFLVLKYLTSYLSCCAPPVSLLGRILTGRIIIPRYDVVLLVPIAAVLAEFAVVGWMHNLGFGKGPAAACGITAFLLILLNVGPSLSKWRLTGAYRLSPKFLAKSQNFVKL